MENKFSLEEMEKYFIEIQTNNIKKPKNCKECFFSDHEAWCLIPGDWRIRYYCPKDRISEYCPIWLNGLIRRPT